MKGILTGIVATVIAGVILFFVIGYFEKCQLQVNNGPIPIEEIDKIAAIGAGMGLWKFYAETGFEYHNVEREATVKTILWISKKLNLSLSQQDFGVKNHFQIRDFFDEVSKKIRRKWGHHAEALYKIRGHSTETLFALGEADGFHKHYLETKHSKIKEIVDRFLLDAAVSMSKACDAYRDSGLDEESYSDGKLIMKDITELDDIIDDKAFKDSIDTLVSETMEWEMQAWKAFKNKYGKKAK